MRNLLVARYLLATVGPSRIWLEWLLLKEKTFSIELRRLEAMQKVFNQPGIQLAETKIRKLVDNVNYLVQKYDSLFRDFKDADSWTSELQQLVKRLNLDKDLKKRLSVNTQIDTDKIIDGVSKYFAEVTSGNPSVDDVLRMVVSIGAYAEGIKPKSKAESAVKTMKSWDFSRSLKALQKAKEVCPELHIPLLGDGSYASFEQWVLELEKALDEEPEDLTQLLDKWEDVLPIWFSEYEPEDLDLNFLEGKRSTVYLHEIELGRLKDFLQQAAKGSMDG